MKTTPNDVVPSGTIRSRRVGLSIQSKLLIMLLVTSLLTAVVVGVIGYLNGRDSLRDAAFDQLTTIRELRTEEIQRDISSLQRGKYTVEIPIQAAALETAATSTYLAWLWYAARRRGLALDGDATDPIADPDQLEQSLAVVGPTLHAGESERDALLKTARLVRYGAGEIIHPAGVVPRHIHFIVSGHVDISVEASGGRVDVTTNGPGDYVGQSALTREPTLTVATAADVTTLLEVPVATVDEIVRSRPLLAKEIGQSLELKRRLANDALAAIGMTALPVPEHAHVG